MARVKGSRNADYEKERERLLHAVRERLLAKDGAQASFRELAEVAGVSVATLRHYFGSREALLSEVMADMHQRGLPYLHATATEFHGPVRESLQWLLQQFLVGWRAGVGEVHAFGLTSSLGHEKLGPVYVQELLEPTLQATEARLSRHIADGELRRCDVRHAALELVCPVVLGMLHQVQLAGSRCRPLDVERFLEDHLDTFLRAYAPEPEPLKARRG
ncbi:MAG TPA: TetR/AcrR family transcriptional regulator [Archangium sp.]|uniref:TetR/AcrR family transcriptional regulator n=1 Tax=Archangium sp. TaxID=1872627 RepID=UPI002E330D5E|nr:TetR/AcrR family transcriptional regulator [Archangium sp.]HEX5752701.1 TetR/AcrR family transcriptional regulator [Archangium sp.]